MYNDTELVCILRDSGVILNTDTYKWERWELWGSGRGKTATTTVEELTGGFWLDVRTLLASARHQYLTNNGRQIQFSPAPGRPWSNWSWVGAIAADASKEDGSNDGFHWYTCSQANRGSSEHWWKLSAEVLLAHSLLQEHTTEILTFK